MIKAISKKIVLDEKKNPLEVIIKYDDWKEIEKLLEGYKKIMSKEKLKKYIGILHLKEDPLSFQRRMRSEWK